MPPAETMHLTLPSDREIMFTREFDAPRHLVWDAHTKPELLKRWLGVNDRWSLDVCEVDLRVGGKYRYVWRGTDSTGKQMEMGMGGTYREIVPYERMVTDETFDHAWYEGACIGTWTLTEQGGKTLLTLRLLYDSKDVRDAVLQSPMKDGMSAGYMALEKLLTSPN